MALDLSPGVLCGGRYRLNARLGEGGVGVVWSARHEITGRPVALKFLRSEAGGRDARQRFIREARALAAIRHPNVIDVYDVLDLADGAPAMVMELLEGETLGQRLARERTLPLGTLADILVPVLSGIEAAHTLGIVHRDLKPENIFLCADLPPGEGVKVLDFGLAKLTAIDGTAARSGSLTATGALMGTPFYMSPEQVFGESDIDARSDIWSLGIIAYECLAGIRPTHAPNVGQILKRITSGNLVDLAEQVPGLPAELTELVRSMLAVRRELRPATVASVRATFERWAGSDLRTPLFAPVPTRRLAPPAQPTRILEMPPATEVIPPRRAGARRSLLAFLAAAAVGSVALLGMARLRSKEDAQPSMAPGVLVPAVDPARAPLSQVPSIPAAAPQMPPATSLPGPAVDAGRGAEAVEPRASKRGTNPGRNRKPAAQPKPTKKPGGEFDGPFDEPFDEAGN